MKLEDVKVGQRVFVRRESTAKLKDPLASAIGETMNTIAKLMGMNIVDVCKEYNGFYVKEILEDGNVALGNKEDDGTISAGWGIYNVSDIELADKEDVENTVFIDIILKEILRTLKEIQGELNPSGTKKQGRGRPKGSPNKKYKGE